METEILIKYTSYVRAWSVAAVRVDDVYLTNVPCRAMNGPWLTLDMTAPTATERNF